LPSERIPYAEREGNKIVAEIWIIGIVLPVTAAHGYAQFAERLAGYGVDLGQGVGTEGLGQDRVAVEVQGRDALVTLCGGGNAD